MSASGLEGISVADTTLSDVDGERGRLVIRGYDVEELAGRVSFEEMCLLLWQGKLPSRSERRALGTALGRARLQAFRELHRLGDAPSLKDGMDALRAATAHLGSAGRPELTGALPVFASAWSRTAAGAAPVEPDPSLGHAADYLRMIRGAPPARAEVDAIDTYLATVAEHGMNASTFAARVVASTGSDAVSAVVAAIGALKGPLHGGAPGPVLDMLDAIGAPENAPAWIEAELRAGRRIMGLGHRVYRVRDPRAGIFERAVERLGRAGMASGRLELARAVERAAVALLRRRHPGRPLEANVEFYTALLLDALGLPRSLFTPTFAVARVAGWLAHFEEQKKTGRIIRPTAHYVGPMPASAGVGA